MLKELTQKCLEIFGTIRTIQSQVFITMLKTPTTKKGRKMKLLNDQGEQLTPVMLTELERSLLSNLVTRHIHQIESLVEEQPAQLPEHKKWMYNLEDKLD